MWHKGFSLKDPFFQLERRGYNFYNARRPNQDVSTLAQHQVQGQAQERVGEKAVQAAEKTPPRPQYLRSTLIQLILLCVLVPIVYVSVGAASAVSLACGAMCALLPQGYFAVRIAAASRRSAQHAARLGLAAEGGKFVLSAVAFALTFAILKPASPGLVFVGFGVFWVIQIVDGIRLLRGGRQA